MLDKGTRDAIGREMRRQHADVPKGALPDRIWRLLLALEDAERTDQVLSEPLAPQPIGCVMLASQARVSSGTRGDSSCLTRAW